MPHTLHPPKTHAAVMRGAACVGNPYVFSAPTPPPPAITDRHIDAMEVMWSDPEVVAHFAERRREDDGSLEEPDSSDRIA